MRRMSMAKYTFFMLFLSVISACSNNKAVEVHDRMNINVAILVYPGVELLDFAGPFEVFNNAEGFHVFTVASEPGKMFTSKGFVFFPDYNLNNAPEPDVLIVPGAPLTELTYLNNNVDLGNWIGQKNSTTKIVMSVCTGALLLSQLGLLDGKMVTTHASMLDTLQKLNPKVKVLSNTDVVEHGKLISTAGINGGIDGALRIVAKLKGNKEALFTAAILGYDKWSLKNGSRKLNK